MDYTKEIGQVLAEAALELAILDNDGITSQELNEIRSDTRLRARIAKALGSGDQKERIELPRLRALLQRKTELGEDEATDKIVNAWKKELKFRRLKNTPRK